MHSVLPSKLKLKLASLRLGVDLEASPRTIQDIEALILEADESVLAHSVRAALTPFEQGPVKPTIISEENLKILTRIVKHCEEPAAGVMLIGKQSEKDAPPAPRVRCRCI